MIEVSYSSLVLDPGSLSRYKDLFESVFGEWTEQGNLPSEVYYVFDDHKLVGFMSGYPMSSSMWYIQRTGYIQDEQRKIKNVTRTREVLSQLHRDWNFLFSVINRDDIPMLKMSLAVGFKIVGTRIDTQNNLWVEMIHGGNTNG